jgi:hypothetical protein
MNLSIKARKAVAAGLAASTVLMTASLGIAPAFAAPHSNGCLVLSGGTVWLITGGVRRGFTSAEVFMSHGYNFGQVIPANSDDVALSVGPIMIYADGTLVKGPVDPLVYLVVNGQKRGFTSGSVFTNLGFSFANIQWAPTNTFMDIPTGAHIDANTSYGSIPHSGPGMQTPTCSGGSTPSPSGPLNGGTGDITVDLLSTYAGEEVGEDEDEVPVLGFEIEAGDDSDVEITSMKVELSQNTGADSDDITDYMSEVSIMMDGEVVGSADADDFNEESGLFTKTISLDGAIVRAEETEEFTVAISSLSNLDSGDIDSDQFNVGVSSIRFLDGDGVTSTDAFTLDVEDGAADDTIEKLFDFASFADATDVELAVSLNTEDEDINLAHIIDVDDADETDDVELLSFVLEAEGDSDINVTEIPVLFTTVEATGDDPDDLLTGASLWLDGDEIASEGFLTSDANGSTETITFEDLDIDIEAGEEVELMVKVDVQDTGSALDNGDTIMADLTATEVDLIEAEDEAGEDVSTTDLTGTANGEASAVYDEGIAVEFVGSSVEKTFTADATGEDDQGTFVIEFDITANDADMAIDKSSEVADANAAGQGVEFSVTCTAGTPVLGSDLLESDTVESTDTSDIFVIEEGTTRSFTLTVIYAADTTPTDGSCYVTLTTINWDNDLADTTPDNFYEFNLSNFKTDALFLNGIA